MCKVSVSLLMYDDVLGLIVNKQYRILMGSDDGVQHSELLCFWTLSIVQYSKN
jgi:hypothetical protein